MLLSTSTVHKFVPIQEAESAQLLYEFATAPKVRAQRYERTCTQIHDVDSPSQDFYHHIERYAASTVLSIAYGKRSVRYNSALLGEFSRDLHRCVDDPRADAPQSTDPSQMDGSDGSR